MEAVHKMMKATEKMLADLIAELEALKEAEKTFTAVIVEAGALAETIKATIKIQP